MLIFSSLYLKRRWEDWYVNKAAPCTVIDVRPGTQRWSIDRSYPPTACQTGRHVGIIDLFTQIPAVGHTKIEKTIKELVWSDQLWSQIC